MRVFAPNLVREEEVINNHAERIPRFPLFPPPHDIIPGFGGPLRGDAGDAGAGFELIANQVAGAMVEIARRELSLGLVTHAPEYPLGKGRWECG